MHVWYRKTRGLPLSIFIANKKKKKRNKNNMRTVVHDGGGDPLAGEAQRPRSLHVQVQFGHAARLTCVVLKNNTFSFIIY